MTEFEEHVQKLLLKYPDLFPTESKFWTYLRGALRRSLWSKSPMKLKFKSSTSTPPPKDYTGRGKKGHVCALTGEWVMTSKSEVDHKVGNVSLRCEDDIIPFIIHLLATDDELQIVDRDAHKVKNYAERYGMTFEEAVIEKRLIQLMKMPVKQITKLLDKHDLPSNNATTRKASLRKLLEEDRL